MWRRGGQSHYTHVMPPRYRQLYDIETGTLTYLLWGEGGEAAIIDPVYDRFERDAALIRELGLNLRYCIDTHCHADHVTAAWLFKETTGCKLAAAQASGIEGLDVALEDGACVHFGGMELLAIATPGHTNGCMSLYLGSEAMVFTGDCLLIRGCGRTDFQQGDAATLFHSITKRLFTLPGNTLVCPGHDYEGRLSSTIDEEQRLNPRVGGGANETDFTGYVTNMRLAHPQRLDVAVPANLVCGRPPQASRPNEPAWAPLVTSYAGIREVLPEWVAGQTTEVTVLDVRSAAEVSERPSGVTGALHIPLDELRERLGEIPVSRPVVTLCRSGRRSAMACQILVAAGRLEVANVRGGLLAWTS